MSVTKKGHSVLVVLSGGQDSTTCLFWAKRNFEHVHALTFNYGQRHAREIDSAEYIARLAGVESHEIADVGPILHGTSPLVSQEKLEQYEDWQSLPGGLEKTFVPGRNALFLVLAANRAYCLRTRHLVTGICQEDFGGYPDCRETFRASMENTLQQALDWNIQIHAPLMNLSKARSVRMAHELGIACWNALAYSHTAYDGAYPPLGHDHANLLRAKGFEQAGLPDPLIIRAVSEQLMELPTTPNYDVLRGWTREQLSFTLAAIQHSFDNPAPFADGAVQKELF
jgi:7-cyano-7-deazaguanine synthase